MGRAFQGIRVSTCAQDPEFCSLFVLKARYWPLVLDSLKGAGLTGFAILDDSSFDF